LWEEPRSRGLSPSDTRSDMGFLDDAEKLVDQHDEQVDDAIEKAR
jgi:hypothetical protein